MKKFNRKFNSICSRIAFWDALIKHFDAFVPLLKPAQTLRPEDVRTLKDIHAMLYECYKAAKARRNIHACELSNLERR